MKAIWTFNWICLAISCAAVSGWAASAHSWDRSVVTLEITRKQYDQQQPWNRRLETVLKSGIVADARHILTTADFLNDTTMIRLQKEGRGSWYQGHLEWIDYHANLALLTSTETNFWVGLKPAAFKNPAQLQGTVEVLRWRNGRLEKTKAEIARWIVKRGKLSWVEHLQMDIQGEINAAGWSEVVVAGSKVIGLTSTHEGNSLSVLPSAFFRPLLAAQRAGSYAGMGFFDFIWQKAENPAVLSCLQLPPPPRGVVILETDTKRGSISPLKPKDVLLRVDGFDIDTEGDYSDPLFGKLSLENLAGRKGAGQRLPMEIWREGKLVKLEYVLPQANYENDLVPQATYDRDPEYLILGGLVFQPLTEPFLRSWGTDWRRKAPFRLVYYANERPSPERPARVLLSAVLPDPYTVGYQDYRFLVVDQVNGRKTSRLSDLVEAIAANSGRFHVIDFAPGEHVHRVVLDVQQMGPATQRVLRRFGIEKDRQMNTPASGH